MESNKSAALASSLTGIICDVRIRRSAGEHRTRLTSANRQRRRHWPPDAMARRCREFVDSRLRRSPPDRASAVPLDKPGKTPCVSPALPTGWRLPTSFTAPCSKDSMKLISGKGETSSRLPAFSLFLPGSCPNYQDRRSLRERRLGSDAPCAILFAIGRKTPTLGGEGRVDDQSKGRSTTPPRKSSNKPPRADAAPGRRDDCPACPPRAAEGDAGHRFSEQRGPRRACTAFGRVPPRAKRNRLRRGTKRGDRIPLGGGAV